MRRLFEASLLFFLATVLFGMPKEKPGLPEEVLPPVRTLDEAGWKKLLSENRGRVLLVNFWATWCGPCRTEMPNVIETYEKWHEQGFEVLDSSWHRMRNLGKSDD